jgi:membrane protease YdiL (CAAX protease family)
MQFDLIFGVIFACIVVVFLPLRAWLRYRRAEPAAASGRYIAETVLLVSMLSLLLWRRGMPMTALGLSLNVSPRWIGDIALCLFIIVGTDVWMTGRIVRQLRRGAMLGPPTGLATDALRGHKAGLSFVMVTLVGAIWEELCFRGTVFALLPHTAIGVVTAITVGSLAFGAQHLRSGPSGLIYSTSFGVVFALLFAATRNLWAVMIAHAAGNLLTAWQWAPQIERARQASLTRRPGFLG